MISFPDSSAMEKSVQFKMGKLTDRELLIKGPNQQVFGLGNQSK
jgi:hypothetical protein